MSDTWFQETLQQIEVTPDLAKIMQLVNYCQQNSCSQEDKDKLEKAVRLIHRPLWEAGRKYYKIRLPERGADIRLIYSPEGVQWKNEYDEISEILEELLKGQEEPAKYHDVHSGEVFLELHDHHTIWKLDTPVASGPGPTPSDEDYYLLVQQAKEIFQEQTKVQIYLLGRSDRHVCVEDTPENRMIFPYLREIALGLEQGVIEQFNAELDPEAENQ